MGNKTSTKNYIYNMKNLSTKLNETGKEIYILETQLSNEDIDVNIKIEIIKKRDLKKKEQNELQSKYMKLKNKIKNNRKVFQ